MRARAFHVVMVVLLLPVSARAERHNWELSAGFSGTNGSTLLGAYAAGAKVWEGIDFSLYVDFSKHAGAHGGGLTLTRTAYLGGGRWWPFGLKQAASGSASGSARTPKPFQPFVHVAVGWIESRLGAADDFAFSWGAGVGADYLFSDHGGLRGQFDWLRHRPAGVPDGYRRLSVGLIYRFEKEYPAPAAVRVPPAPPDRRSRVSGGR